jgi:two-component system NtrC family sensor kinase
MLFLTLGANMTRPSRTDGKTSEAKARNASPAKGRKTTKTKRRIAPVATRVKRRSVSGLSQDLKEVREQQAATAEILKAIASSPSDTTPVFEAIASSAKRLLGGYSAAVFRNVDGNVHLAAFTPTKPAADEALRADFPTPVEQFVAFRLAQHGKPFPISDTEEVSHAPVTAIARLHGFRSMLWVPMVNGDVTIGIISVTRVEPGAFAPHHTQLLQTFADQAVIAIENTRLFNETREALERQTATAEILKVIASSPSDVQPVFDAIAASANRLLGGFSSTVFRFVDGMAHLKAFTPTTPEADEVLQSSFPRPVADFAAFQTTQAGEVMQVPDTEAPGYELKEIARARGYRSMLYTPLMNKGESIGFIAVTRLQPGSFPNHHVQLLRTFADQAVIAIENARLFKETREALERQTATADILKVIASSPSDVAPVFEAIATSANRLLGGYSTAVFRYVEGMACLEAFTPTTPAADEVLTSSFPLPQADFEPLELAKGGEPVQIPDGDQLTHPRVRQISQARGWRSMLLVPLMNAETPIGVITVTRTETGIFADHHVQLLQTFADQAVIAISNVGLFNEVQERTRELSRSLDDLRAAQDRLVQTEKLASLGQLTAGIAHEIKNPLNFVNNFSALSAELTGELNDVLKAAALTDKIREEVDELTKMLKDNLEKVVQHGKRADSIVKNMLLHSREGSGEHRPADINSLLDESLNLAYHGARAEKPGFNITLQRDFDAAAGSVELFPQEITRAFLNLISNSFYAATKRKTENGQSGFEPILTASTKNLGSTVEIRIRDNGTGIPSEVQEKMFNPFFTTKPAGEGTGLGLSMTHDIIVKQHGGRIDVVTNPGQFTEFIIVLPKKSNVSGSDRGET